LWISPLIKNGAPGRLTREHLTKLTMLARDKISSLFVRSVSKKEKKLYNIGKVFTRCHLIEPIIVS
jgi:hypothetical protein